MDTCKVSTDLSLETRSSVKLSSYFCNGFENTWLRMIYCLQIIENSSGGYRVLPFRVGRTWFKLAVTSSNQFLPVVAHDK